MGFWEWIGEGRSIERLADDVTDQVITQWGCPADLDHKGSIEHLRDSIYEYIHDMLYEYPIKATTVGEAKDELMAILDNAYVNWDWTEELIGAGILTPESGIVTDEEV